MDAVIKGKARAEGEPFNRPSRDEAEDAVRTLIAWAGDDPRREGLIDTPGRVVDAYEEWFKGNTKIVFEGYDPTNGKGLWGYLHTEVEDWS